MPYDFKFPDVGEGIAEGEIVKWRVKEGDSVKEHDVLVEVETDKAIVEIPSPQSGIILKIHHKEGDTVKVGETLVTIGGAGEEIKKEVVQETKIEREEPSKEKPLEASAFVKKSVSVVGELEEAPETDAQQTEARSASSDFASSGLEEETKPPAESAEQKPSEPAIVALPAVRRLARDLNVDLSAVKGTGLDGRITEEDVRKVAEQKAAKEEEPAIRVKRKYDMFGPVEYIPLKGVRKTIARNMSRSWSTAVHVTHMDEADVTELWKIRETEKTKAEKKGVHLTFLPFVVKAVIHALKDHPYVNAAIDDEHEEIILKKYYNIGVAVDTQDGLIVPVIKIADQKSILDIAKEIEQLADKAQKRALDLMDLKGGTFTVTNVGVYGGAHATPIINWPEVAILGTGRIVDRPRYNDKGKLVKKKILPLSLTFDHRIVDGAEAARFMNRLKEHLEDPALIMVDRD